MRARSSRWLRGGGRLAEVGERVKEKDGLVKGRYWLTRFLPWSTIWIERGELAGMAEERMRAYIVEGGVHVDESYVRGRENCGNCWRNGGELGTVNRRQRTYCASRVSGRKGSESKPRLGNDVKRSEEGEKTRPRVENRDPLGHVAERFKHPSTRRTNLETAPKSSEGRSSAPPLLPPLPTFRTARHGPAAAHITSASSP
jgi:hypothetical protein